MPTRSAFGGDNPPRLEHYEPAHAYAYSNSTQADRAGVLRQEAIEARNKTWLGRSTVRTLCAGQRFQLSDGPLEGIGDAPERSPTSGGGGSVCCVVWQRGSKLPVKIKVRWVAGYCMHIETNQYGRSRDRRRSLWKEQDALITEAISEKPRALEVHFYRDGRIEAAATQGDSPPRLKLSRNPNYDRPGVSQEFPRCPDDTK